MRLTKLSRMLLLLALPVGMCGFAEAQDHPNVMPSRVASQLNQVPAGTTPVVSSPAPAPQQSKPMKSMGKAAAKSPAKTAEKKPATASTKTPVEKPAQEKTLVGRRDPFDALLNKPAAGGGTPQVLPPGKAGLVVGSLQIDGIVGGAHGMIAIVSNPQQRVYFLREGDKLYDGTVQHITIEAVSFQEVGKDAFGKPMERQVTRRLYPSPGEQQ
jgi:Tfp pilus assembly protein PilP